jgi:hypothetical protein
MYLLKHKDFYVPKMLGSKVGLKGEFRFILEDENGNIKRDTGWFDNLITDIGLQMWCETPFITSTMHLGSDGTAAAFTDTAMGAKLINTYVDYIAAGNSGAPSYDMYTSCECVFAAGTATGTIREAGMGMDYGAGIFSRTVVTPEIVKGAQDQLTGYWRINITPDLTDSTGTVMLDGVSYDWIGRFCDLDDTWASGGRTHCRFRGSLGGASDGVIQTVDLRPTGTMRSGSFVRTSGMESAGVYYAGLEMTYTHDNANGFISAFHLPGDWGGQYDGGLQFSLGKTSDGTPLEKLNTHTLIVEGRVLASRT